MQTNISIRVDKDIKDRFSNLCNAFGLSTTAAFNLFMKAVIRERKIPFEISTEEPREFKQSGYRPFEELRQQIAPTRIQDLSLEEINSEIKAYRKERKIREEGLQAFRKMREIVAETGVAEPTLDEINAEIKAVRNAIR